MNELELISNITQIILNAPLEKTSEVKGRNFDTIQDIYTCEIKVGNDTYLLTEIDYEREIYYHMLITCNDFDVCVTDFAHGKSKGNDPKLDIARGTPEQIAEAITVIALTYPEYFKYN